ncbi:NUDIX hydrolase [Spirochaeta cellobiosiphila]|uniref:NUDIX hydrolase n=1 Tax=Spirochaeta cellobiosiphila TaxID=504483 RepID=UPI00040E5839|nr:NUDIX domain-containing protein [Spirochaeta cellobiosiphila]
MAFTYKYPRLALTVDCVVFGLDHSELKILLIERGSTPFKGQWALPGGFVNMDETLEQAALRELEEETGMNNLFLEQLYTFSEVERDPRDRVVSVAFYALVNINEHDLKAASDARNSCWYSLKDHPPLAFDHELILDTALSRLKGKVRYQPIGFELLPPLFTLRQLQTLYETILEVSMDKRNFRRKILSMNLLEETDQFEQDVSYRAAKLYRFHKEHYDNLIKSGFNFEV